MLMAPDVFESGVFALKGGTAINLFVRDMPRLSVDLDLVFPDHSLPRDQALAQINEAVLRWHSLEWSSGSSFHVPTAHDKTLAQMSSESSIAPGC
jgi:predicted nucleotidyltransferase component of viral defense system